MKTSKGTCEIGPASALLQPAELAEECVRFDGALLERQRATHDQTDEHRAFARMLKERPETALIYRRMLCACT